MTRRVAIAPQRLRFSCSISRDGLASVWVTDTTGVTYRALGADLADELAGLSRGASFRRVHRGVIVGPGPLNNRLVTLVLEFAVRGEGIATADVIAVRIEPPRSRSPAKRGRFPDCEGSGEP